MGCTDKGLQDFDGEPLIAHVLRGLGPQVDAILISANRNLDRYSAFGHPVVSDAHADFRGPLAGLLAGLVACRTDYLITVPCDAPFLPRDLVARLAAPFAHAACDLTVARAGGRLQPVFCLVRTAVAVDLAAFIEEGGRAVGAWIERCGGRAVSFDDESSFCNLNTLADLRDAARDASGAAARNSSCAMPGTDA